MSHVATNLLPVNFLLPLELSQGHGRLKTKNMRLPLCLADNDFDNLFLFAARDDSSRSETFSRVFLAKGRNLADLLLVRLKRWITTWEWM